MEWAYLDLRRYAHPMFYAFRGPLYSLPGLSVTGGWFFQRAYTS